MTIQTIVNIAKLSQPYCLLDITKKGLFGGGVDLLLPRKIYTVRKDVNWLLDLEGLTDEVKATGTVTITNVGANGNILTITVDDPLLGVINLVEYTKTSFDTDTTVFATDVVVTFNLYFAQYGYVLTSVNNVIYILARQGVGAAANGQLSINAGGTIGATLVNFSGGVTAVLPSDELIQMSNYLYALCTPYNGKAEYTLTQGLSGNVIKPTTPSISTPNPLEFVVSANSPIIIGGSTLVINAYKGYNLIFSRNNQPQAQVDNGGTYYEWNKTTGLFRCFGVANESELFSITPVI